MNLSNLLLLIFSCLIITNVFTTDGKVCQSEACKKLSKYLKIIMDDCVDPCEDFSEFVCGNFDRNHKIPEGRTSASTFDDIGDDIALVLKHLFEKQSLVNSSSPQTKAAIYYRSCLNMTHRNAISKDPFLNVVNQINKEGSYENKLRKLISTGIANRIVSFSADQDSKNPEYYILNIGKGQLILDEPTLRSPGGEEEKKIISSYKKYMNSVLDILGLWKENRTMVDNIVDLNIKVAKALPSFSDQMDPDKSYNKVTISDLERRCKTIPWLTLINSLLADTGTVLCATDSVVVSSLEYVHEVCQIIDTYKANAELSKVLDNDLIWAAISSLVKYGSNDLVHASQEYQKETMGVVGKEELWTTCVSSTSETLVEIVGNMYVKENFDDTKKKDAEQMLSNIREVFGTVIKGISWMDNQTKEMATLKLKSINQKIGYSERILNESKLFNDNKKVNMDIKTYIANYLGFMEQEYIRSVEGVGQRSPTDKWFMGAQEVNAYYNPPSNEIVFPAAIFRFPFYDIDFPPAINYGGIGEFIGHEILHGFDTSGSKYDDKGRIRNWWTKETKDEYNNRAQCIIDQYGNYSIYGKKLQSEQTIGEDIADNAGNRMAFMGLQLPNVKATTLPGLKYTSDQLYFISAAVTWCSMFTKESILDKIKNDEHTIWKFRINGPVSNAPDFSKAFNCSHEKPMNRHKKCIVW